MALLIVVLSESSAWQVFAAMDWMPAVGVVAVTTAMHAFRQRFFLDPAQERGVPARAWTLRFAKWPVILLAVVDVLRDRQIGYVMTAKKDRPKAENPLLALHVPALALVLGAWALASVRGIIISVPAQLAVFLFMAATILLILQGWRVQPPPFDRALARRANDRDGEALHRRLGRPALGEPVL